MAVPLANLKSNPTGTTFELKLVCFQPAFTCTKLTIETLEQGVKYARA